MYSIQKSFQEKKQILLEELESKNYRKFLEISNEICSKYIPPTSPYDMFYDVVPYSKEVSATYQCEYINASFVDRFIAAQEPKAKFREKFVKFIEKSKIELIISLNEESESMPKEYLISRISVNNFLDEEYEIGIKKIRRIHYRAWVDKHTISEEAIESLFQYISKISAFNEYKKTLIHCKAGVGRTGTFILYSLCREEKRTITHDFFVEKFSQLRCSRPLIVETPSQLEFLAKKFLETIKN